MQIRFVTPAVWKAIIPKLHDAESRYDIKIVIVTEHVNSIVVKQQGKIQLFVLVPFKQPVKGREGNPDVGFSETAKHPRKIEVQPLV